MRTITVELPENLAKRYLRYANEHGRPEGESIFASVLIDAYAYRSLRYVLARATGEPEEARGDAVMRLGAEQLDIEDDERAEANARANDEHWREQL